MLRDSQERFLQLSIWSPFINKDRDQTEKAQKERQQRTRRSSVRSTEHQIKFITSDGLF